MAELSPEEVVAVLERLLAVVDGLPPTCDRLAYLQALSIVLRLSRLVLDQEPLAADRLARELYAMRHAELTREEFEPPGGRRCWPISVETAWAADGRVRGECYDAATRALQAIRALVTDSALWDWHPDEATR